MQSANLKVTNVKLDELSGDVLILPTVADRIDESQFNKEIYRAAGDQVTEAFKRDLPLRIGNVSVTSAGNLPVREIVHAPVQTAPNVPTTEENLQIGLRSALVTADENGVTTVLLARLIPEDQSENVDLSSAAETLHDDLNQYPPAHFDEIRILARDRKWLNALSDVFPAETA